MTRSRIDTPSRWRRPRAALVAALAFAALAAVGQGYSLFCGNHIVDGRQCRYSVNPNCLDAPTPAQEEAAIDNAGATWSAGGANFAFVDLGTTTRQSVSPNDQRQDIFWRNESSGSALAVTVCGGSSVSTGADILYYDNGWNWQIGGSLDIQTVALHEMGHLLGLGHTNTAGSVMLPNYHGIDRDLGTDDRNGLIFVYGVGGPPPNLVSILPTSGQVRGGEEVTLTGTDFNENAVVTFDGEVAAVVERIGSTGIVVESPPGTSIGQTADVVVSQGSGSDTLANAYTYGHNATDLEIQGTTGIGDVVDVVIYGEANRRAWIALGPPGTFTKSGITICATSPFRLRAAPPVSTLGPLGEKAVPWTVSGFAFETLNAQGVVKRAGGVLELTPCVVMTVFP
jgi:hypothetical protein